MRIAIFASFLLLLASMAFADLQDDVKIKSIQAVQMKQLGDRLVYSVKVDVENAGDRGNIFVNVIGVNAEGFQLALVPMHGRFDANQAQSLTAQTLVNPQNGEITEWRAKNFGKSPAQ